MHTMSNSPFLILTFLKILVDTRYAFFGISFMTWYRWSQYHQTFHVHPQDISYATQYIIQDIVYISKTIFFSLKFTLCKSLRPLCAKSDQFLEIEFVFWLYHLPFFIFQSVLYHNMDVNRLTVAQSNLYFLVTERISNLKVIPIFYKGLTCDPFICNRFEDL